MTATTTYRASQTGRTEWMTDVFAALNAATAPAPIEVVDAALARIAEEGPRLGRTARWQEAIGWFAAETGPEATEEHRRWALLQGSVWLGYANL